MMVRIRVRVLCCFFLSLWIGISTHGNLYGQITEIQIGENYDGQTFLEFIEQVEEQQPVHFYFVPDWVEGIRIRQAQTPMALTALLDATIRDTELTFFLLNNRIILSKGDLIGENKDLVLTQPVPILRKPEPAEIRFSPPLPIRASKLPAETPIPSQKILKIGVAKDKDRTNATIVGYVRDISNGEPLIGAAVIVDELQIGTSTDQYGYYSLTLPVDKHEIIFQSYGKEEKRQEIDLVGDGFLDMELEAAIIELDEVLIESERDANISSSRMGLARMDIQTLKQNASPDGRD